MKNYIIWTLNNTLQTFTMGVTLIHFKILGEPETFYYIGLLLYGYIFSTITFYFKTLKHKNEQLQENAGNKKNDGSI